MASGCQYLYLNTDIGYPRLVDLLHVPNEDGDMVKFADMVVTVLHSHGRATLDAFLDLSKPTFYFKPEYAKDNKRRFGLERNGTTILCGWRDENDNSGLQPCPRWNSCFEYRIEPSGRWTPVSCTDLEGEKCTAPDTVATLVAKGFAPWVFLVGPWRQRKSLTAVWGFGA